MKIRRTITILLAIVTVLVFTACNVKGGMYSDKNAYVSVYLYGAGGKSLRTVEALRVAPLEATEEEETMEGGNLTEEAARNRYRTTPTPMYALELMITNKDKNAELPEVVVSQLSNGEIEYTLDSILGNSAGKASGSNDIYEWVCTVNDEVANPFTAKLENYDKVVFTLNELTNRTFTASFEINNGEVTLVSETSFDVNGEKSELNIAKFLESDYLDEKTQNPVKPVKSALDITLSEDGKSIVKIGDIENDDTHQWICYIGDEEEGLVSDLSKELISEIFTIYFDYREISEETENTAPAEDNAAQAEETAE